MANEQNLIPMDQRSESEVRELGSKGGKASGVARRRKRSLKEAADLYLSLPVSDRRTWNRIARTGVAPDDIDNQMAMIIGLTIAAANGDARAARIIVDLLGEDSRETATRENNLLSVLQNTGEIDTDDLPEVE